MAAVYCDVKTLPETIQSALRDAGVHRPVIRIEPRETDCMRTGAYGDGYQAFTVLVDIDTGRTSERFEGSWGGGNAYTFGPTTQAAVDHDETQRPLPPNACVIHGQRGGGKPPSATLVVHPSRVAKLLPVANDGELSPRLKTLLAVYRCYNSRGRSEWFERHGTGTPEEIADLAKRGLIKVNKAGSVTITADGRNVSVSDDNRIYNGWLKA